MSNHRPISTFLAIAAGLVLTGECTAAIINVPGDFGTIQAAIADPGTVAGDEVVVAPGTYFETINFLGKAITVRSTDPNDAGVVLNTIINGGGAGSVVTCNGGEGSNTVLSGFVITGGNTTFGGGMINAGSSPTVRNCTFIGNYAPGGGGGMLNTRSSPTVSNCTFSGNSAPGGGGGMYNAGSPTVTNCTFIGNSAFEGGGMYNFTGSPTVTNCSFSENTASNSGGGMFNTLFTIPMVTNCILWGDSPEEFSVSGTPTVTYSDVQGSFPGTGNIDADPLFVDPDNGDFRLLPESPCIDAGDNTAVPLTTTTDLDGNPRFIDDPDTPDCQQAPGTCGDPPIVDMGAYEFQGLSCPWDLNGDGVVGGLDLLELVFSFGPCDDPEDCPADFNDDGIVNVLDLIELIHNLGPCPAPDECPWDIDGDGVVDLSDLFSVLENIGPCDDPGSCPWDFNGNGVVDVADVLALIANFGPCPGSEQSG